MKKVYKAILLASLILVLRPAFSQDFSSLVETMMSKKNAAVKAKVPEYGEAEELAKNADLELQAGNVRKANELILKSIEKYPVKAVFNYAITLAKLPDVAGSNLIIDKLTERVKNHPTDKLILQNAYTKAIEEVDKNTVLCAFAVEQYNMNRAYGNVSQITKSALAFDKLEIPNSGTAAPVFKAMKYQAKLDQAILYGHTDEGLMVIEEMRKNKVVNNDSYFIVLSALYTEVGDPAKGLEYAKNIKKNLSHTVYFQAYTLLGKTDAALEEYREQRKIVPKETPKELYYLALIDIQKGDTESAITKLLSLRGRGTDIFGVYTQEEMWRIYTTLGDAYTKQKQFSKAKDNYNIALLYHPEFKPAIEGLSKLEVITATEQATDKTAPEILVLEPTPKRGLKVTATGSSVMVKGLAKDLSGIKEVLINGTKVYSQLAGDFWGDVPMTAGVNKITIVATDIAGNRAEKVFEIEKETKPVIAANTPVAPVEEKEGKNYCLLIAAQNYSDSSIPSLENPIADAVKLKLVLKNNYSFNESNIFTLFNPQNNDLKRQLLELSSTIQPEDNLVIFYAGHGIWVDKEKKGYWLMTDAQYKDRNTWLPNKDVLDLIAKLPSRHTLLITDACFSGSVFKTRGLKAGAPAAIREMDSKISRVAITSGNDTEVPDESVFMKYLVKALSENKEQYLTAQKMFITKILESVMTETKTEPRYGTLELAGHIGGDFIFTHK